MQSLDERITRSIAAKLARLRPDRHGGKKNFGFVIPRKKQFL